MSGSVSEDGAPSTLDALANASDADTGDVLSVVNIQAVLPAGVSYDAVSHSFTLDPADAAFQALAVGATTTVSVNFDVSDGKDVTPAVVGWTITGVNDAPSVSGAVTGNATEDGATVSLDALGNASDVDFGDTLSVTPLLISLPAGVSFDAPSHTFTLDPTDEAFQSLAAGATTTVTVNFDVTDGTSTTSASVTWTVTGVNDTPVLSGAGAGNATEDGASSSLNALANASDADTGDTVSVVNVPASLPHGVSYNASSKSFTLDPSDAAFQSLASGATTTVTVNYDVSDGTSTTAASVTWTVTGVNDAPAVLLSVGAPDATGMVTGAVQAMDAEGDTLAYTVTTSAVKGAVVLNADGTFTYTPSQAAIDAASLCTATTADRQDSFTVTTDDGFGGSVDTVVNVPVAPARLVVSGIGTAYALAVSPDGARAYVGTVEGEIIVVDTATNTVETTIPTPAFVFGLAVSPDGTTLYASQYTNGNILSIDTSTFVITSHAIPRTNGGAASNHAYIALSADGTKLYTTNIADDSVAVVDTSNFSVIQNLSGFDDPHIIAVGSNGKVYVSNWGPSGTGTTVTEIDPANAYALTHIGGPGDFSGPFGVDISVDGTKLYVANHTDGTVKVVDTATRAVSSLYSSADTSNSVLYVAVADNGNYVFVSDYGTSSVESLVTSNGQTDASYPGFTAPSVMRFYPDGTRLFVTDGTAGLKTLCL